MHHANTLSNPIHVDTNTVTVDEHPVTQDADPVLDETFKRRKTRIERFSFDMKKGIIKLHHMHTGLVTIAEVWKEFN